MSPFIPECTIQPGDVVSLETGRGGAVKGDEGCLHQPRVDVPGALVDVALKIAS